ncbi:predicted protein, partial [Nematostella vectensis]
DAVVMERLIEKYMSLPNQAWDNIVREATRNIDHLRDLEVVKQLGNILKTNVRGCKSIGHPFVTQLGRIYLDMLNVYRCLSENISMAISENGELVMKQPLIRAMRTVKTEVLRLISTWVSKSNDPKLVCDNFIPPLLDAVLGDYQRNVPGAREPEVLSTMATFINKLEANVTENVSQIFDAVFECTLNMINKDFEEFPEHRTNFFLLLQAVVQHCFQALLKIPPEQFKLVLDSIVWAFKHTMRNVADTGLHILYSLLKNMEAEEASQSFYQTYYITIVQHVLSVVTDTSHTAGLTMHATILAHMFSLAESGKITQPLFNSSEAQYASNQVCTACFVIDRSSLGEARTQDFSWGVFILGQARWFASAKIKEYRSEDSTDLYLEERETQLKSAEEEKRKVQLSVPGIVNPHDMPEEMQD